MTNTGCVTAHRFKIGAERRPPIQSDWRALQALATNPLAGLAQ